MTTNSAVNGDVMKVKTVINVIKIVLGVSKK